MSRIVQIEEYGLGELCEIRNRLWPNQIRSVEEIQRIDQAIDFGRRPRRWLAFAGGVAVGFAEAGPRIGAAAGRYELSVGTLPEYRGLGHGRRLFEAAWTHLESFEEGSAITEAMENDAASLAFAERRGFTEVKRDFESLLDLSGIHDRGLEIALLEEEIQVLPMAAVDSLAFRLAFHRLFEAVRQDVPRSDPPKPLGFEFFNDVVLGDPAFLWEGSHVALHQGEPIGFCGVFRSARDGWVDQWLTAVLPTWRRRGIAFALKAKAIRWAKHHGYQTIRTDNDSRNTAMLALNDRLGFVRQPAFITLRAALSGNK